MMLELSRLRRHHGWHRVKAARLAPRKSRIHISLTLAIVVTLAAIFVFAREFLMFSVESTHRMRPFAIATRPFVLSQTSVYRKHFVPPPSTSALGSAEVLAQLRSRQASAAAKLRGENYTQPNLGASLLPRWIKPSKGLTFSDELKGTGFTQLQQMLDPICPGPDLSRIPASNSSTKTMCLNVVSNAFAGREGTAVQVHSRTLYDIAGGCCAWDWPMYLNRRVALWPSSWDTLFNRKRERALLVLAHHHSTTYFHVMTEVMLRYLQLVPLLEAVPEIDVLIDAGDVAYDLLLMLGLAPERIVQFESGSTPDWVFRCILLFPPPLQHALYEDHYPLSAARDISAILRELVKKRRYVLRDEETAAAVVETGAVAEKPLMLLMERAVRRASSGRCHESRCLRNFEEVRGALEQRFGRDYSVEVYRATARVQEALEVFSRAKVVIGVHGAGFQNMMFCNPNTTVIHIGWHDFYRDLATQCGLSFHLIHAPGMTRSCYNYRLRDVPRFVQNVSDAIGKDREKFS